MAMTQKKVDEYTCDGCGSIQCVEVDEIPLGIVGNLMIHTQQGGWPQEFFACKKGCLAKATVNAFNRDVDY